MTIHFVVPPGIDDPVRPSGGNVYDRRLADGLRARGHAVHEHVAAPADLEDVLASLMDGTTVLVDGLVACFAPRPVERHALRLRILALAHLCFAEVAADAAEDERRALGAATEVVAVSRWTRSRLLARHGLDPGRVHVAVPGADPGPTPSGTASGSPSGSRLLLVGAVTRAKGVDVLVSALSRLADLDWTCRVVGPTDREPAFATAVRRAAPPGLRLVRPRGHDALLREYAGADLLVVPTRSDSFGIVAVEALAHGVPVVASDVGGVPEAVGSVHGRLPGLLVPPGDPGALATALRSWLADPDLRAAWRATAAARRTTVTSWDHTVTAVERVLVPAGVRS